MLKLNSINNKVLIFRAYKGVLSLFLFLFCTIISCKKNSNINSDIPYIRINEIVYLNNINYIKLNSIGGWDYLGIGSRGVILYRKSQNEFLAFERHCPYQSYLACAKVSVENNITAHDSCCGSTFSLIDGSIISGPATIPLLQYNVNYNFSLNQLTITN